MARSRVSFCVSRLRLESFVAIIADRRHPYPGAFILDRFIACDTGGSCRCGARTPTADGLSLCRLHTQAARSCCDTVSYNSLVFSILGCLYTTRALFTILL